MDISTIKNDDIAVLGDLYSRVRQITAVNILEARETIEDPVDEIEGIFSNIEEVNISIQDTSGFGELRYKGLPRKDSHENTIVCDVIGEEDMFFKVTKLSNNDKDLNITVYQSNDVVDTFVSSVSFIDPIEKELNIIKQELV